MKGRILRQKHSSCLPNNVTLQLIVVLGGFHESHQGSDLELFWTCYLTALFGKMKTTSIRDILYLLSWWSLSWRQPRVSLWALGQMKDTWSDGQRFVIEQTRGNKRISTSKNPGESWSGCCRLVIRGPEVNAPKVKKSLHQSIHFRALENPSCWPHVRLEQTSLTFSLSFLFRFLGLVSVKA